jgi:hypothetical protein
VVQVIVAPVVVMPPAATLEMTGGAIVASRRMFETDVVMLASEVAPVDSPASASADVLIESLT